MRQYLLTASLLLSLGLAACADHSGAIASIEPAPQPPIGPSDGNTVGNGNTDPLGEEPGSVPGGGGGFDGGGGSPGDGGGKGGGGTPGGSPVPEPGTMLLVGTGLAGAALMRRRRQLRVETAE